MNREIIRKIAKQNGVSAEEVMREMQRALNVAYANPNEAAEAIPRKGDVPTPEEFVDYVTDAIQSEISKKKPPN